jgi:hypothetical protein
MIYFEVCAENEVKFRDLSCKFARDSVHAPHTVDKSAVIGKFSASTCAQEFWIPRFIPEKWAYFWPAIVVRIIHDCRYRVADADTTMGDTDTAMGYPSLGHTIADRDGEI